MFATIRARVLTETKVPVIADSRGPLLRIGRTTERPRTTFASPSTSASLKHLRKERQLNLVPVIEPIRAMFIPFSNFHIKVDRGEGVTGRSPENVVNDLEIPP
jgi:hypothetical protein